MPAMAEMIGLCLASILAFAAGQGILLCHDIDIMACQLMAAQKSDFCSDLTLAKSACPRFCKLCPLQCYHCDAAVANIDQCNASKSCSDGEVCMRKELKSYMDGHREYQLSCEAKQHCDGTALTLPFGKRHVTSRDLVISCCGTDLCNKVPAVTTTTFTTTFTTTTVPQSTTPASKCRKDIIILVEDGHINGVGDYISHFLNRLVEKLDIGPNDALVTLIKYHGHIHVKWTLNEYTNKASLENAIANQDFLTSGSSSPNNLDVALNYLINNGSSVGNRANADDVVIILTEHAPSYWHDATLLQQVHAKYADVFAYSVGHTVDTDDLSGIATDSNHVIDHVWRDTFGTHVDTYYSQLAAKICG